ncbi:MAG TPA: ABC transporter permease [Candidatus Deferrimicrobium sp.]|nr:ABC transporter permease [Candidatus Deferrimicrobium sp.]
MRAQAFSIPWLAIVSMLLMVFLFAPLALAALYAFSAVPSLTWPFQGWSLQWFEKLFADPGFRKALLTSFEVAIITAVAATLIGTVAAFVFTRLFDRLTATSQAMARLPVMLPGLFIGVGFVALMILLRFSPGTPVITAGHIVVAVPWVILVVSARLLTYDIELEAAARDLGAGPFQTLRRVTLPIIAPAVAGAALLAFAWSFDETLITVFTRGQETTVPLYIVGKLRRVVDPTGNAVATILLLIPWVAFGLAAIFMRKSGGVSAMMGQRR